MSENTALVTNPDFDVVLSPKMTSEDVLLIIESRMKASLKKELDKEITILEEKEKERDALNYEVKEEVEKFVKEKVKGIYLAACIKELGIYANVDSENASFTSTEDIRQAIDYQIERNIIYNKESVTIKIEFWDESEEGIITIRKCIEYDNKFKDKISEKYNNLLEFDQIIRKHSGKINVLRGKLGNVFYIARELKGDILSSVTEKSGNCEGVLTLFDTLIKEKIND